jgi:copper chaperone
MSIKKETLKINGMSCGGCVKSVTRALEQTEGVTVEHVEIGLATITYDPAKATRDAIAEAIDGAGFELVERV